MMVHARYDAKHPDGRMRDVAHPRDRQSPGVCREGNACAGHSQAERCRNAALVSTVTRKYNNALWNPPGVRAISKSLFVLGILGNPGAKSPFGGAVFTEAEKNNHSLRMLQRPSRANSRSNVLGNQDEGFAQGLQDGKYKGQERTEHSSGRTLLLRFHLACIAHFCERSQLGETAVSLTS